MWVVGAETTIDAGTEGPRVPTAAMARAYLVVRSGDRRMLLDVRDGETIHIGRADRATVRLDDPKASREHARIACEAGRLTLEDLGSRNGTRVNQDVVKQATRALGSGDVVWIGETEILVAGARAEASEAALPAIEVPGLIVADEAMVQVFRNIDRVAPLSTTVLLQGETGVGKEVVAEQLHARSGRSTAPFVRINCGALPDSLIESELFGHERGAFTGADRRKPGLFEVAQGGTLFLDEIGELKLELQAKLLRVLEAKKVLRVGGRQELDVDVRIVAASNRDLEREAKQGRFRSDLYFRLSTFAVHIPALRERPNEIGLLAELFARQLSLRMGRSAPAIADSTRALLEHHPWPGNVRELRNVIERALVLVDGGVVLPEHLPPGITTSAEPVATGSFRDRVESVEQRSIEEALAAEGGNQTRAAKRLGVSRRTLVYKLDKYDLRPRDKK